MNRRSDKAGQGKEQVVKRILHRAELLGHGIFYLVLRYLGYEPARWLLHFVVLVFCLLSRNIHGRTRPYLSRIFPDANVLSLWWFTYRLCCNFGMVLVERAWMGICPEAEIRAEFPESGRMYEIMDEGRGVIIVNAHVGTWQMAMSLLSESPVGINIHMRYDEEAAARHYFDLQGGSCPFNIIRSDDNFGGMLEASAAILKGDAVVMMGDRWNPGTRGVDIKFLGDRARIPVSPYYLASATGATVIVLFTRATGPKSYRADIYDVFQVSPEAKHDPAAVREYAQRYAELLEKYVKKYPLQWYNFYDYWATGTTETDEKADEPKLKQRF